MRDDGDMRKFPPSPITSLIDETPLFNLGESTSPDLTVEELVGAEAAAELDKFRLGYGTSAGDSELRGLLAANLGVRDDQVLVTAGAAAALFLLGLLFGDEEGEVVVVRPCFPPVLDALWGTGARISTPRLQFEDGYRLNVTAVSDTLTASTRLVMLASPQNPSGVALARSEAEQLLAVMARVCPQAYLLVDETYREAVHGHALPAESFASLSPRVLTCASLSKSHGAPGLRIGWLTVPDADLYAQLRLAKFNTAVACGSLDEFLATRLLRRAEEVLASRRAFLVDALAVVEEWAGRRRDLLRWIRPDAGAFCCVQLDPVVFGFDDVRRFHAALARRRTLVSRGEWFGDSEHVFRLGFGHVPMETLRAGLDVVGEALSCWDPARR